MCPDLFSMEGPFQLSDFDLLSHKVCNQIANLLIQSDVCMFENKPNMISSAVCSNNNNLKMAAGHSFY